MTNSQKQEILEKVWEAHDRASDEGYYQTATVLADVAEMFDNDELTVKGLALYIVKNCPQA